MNRDATEWATSAYKDKGQGCRPWDFWLCGAKSELKEPSQNVWLWSTRIRIRKLFYRLCCERNTSCQIREWTRCFPIFSQVFNTVIIVLWTCQGIPFFAMHFAVFSTSEQDGDRNSSTRLFALNKLQSRARECDSRLIRTRMLLVNQRYVDMVRVKPFFVHFPFVFSKLMREYSWLPLFVINHALSSCPRI